MCQNKSFIRLTPDRVLPFLRANLQFFLNFLTGNEGQRLPFQEEESTENSFLYFLPKTFKVFAVTKFNTFATYLMMDKEKIKRKKNKLGRERENDLERRERERERGELTDLCKKRNLSVGALAIYLNASNEITPKWIAHPPRKLNDRAGQLPYFSSKSKF
jgi:hypothetical protein